MMSDERIVSEAPQHSQPAQLQAIRAYKKPYPPRKSRKPQAVKTAVIVKRANGANITSIANDLGITRNTTRTILAESDIDQHLEDNRLQSVRLIPEAIRVAEIRLAANSENMAIKVLENTIWPLQSKTSKVGDPSLVLAIQNLMGNVQVSAPATTTNSAEATKSSAIIAESVQVIENKDSAG